jgi:hypothetical protein
VVAPAQGETFDSDRILMALATHQVEFVVVGGIAARAHGASRATADFDCIPANDIENLDRLAKALTVLNARLRVAGMSDYEARGLPIRLDSLTLAAFGSSTWMTDFGPLDLLIELRGPQGARRSYNDLLERSIEIRVGDVAVRIASLRDIVESKEFASRPKDFEALPELRDLLARQNP